MIGYLEGTLKAVRPTFCIVLAGGVGYKVFVAKDALSTLKAGNTVHLWTHLAVRETALDLYGFTSEIEMKFFELLLTVSGIGPKSAIGILDIAPVETLRSAIVGGKAEYLTKVSGIGRKTAEKIVLELRDKVGASTETGDAAQIEDAEVLEALHALGYSTNETREMLRKIPATVVGANERLREALKLLGKH